MSNGINKIIKKRKGSELKIKNIIDGPIPDNHKTTVYKSGLTISISQQVPREFTEEGFQALEYKTLGEIK